MKASNNGEYPVILDASACSLRMKTFLAERLTVLDLVEFAHDALLPRLMLHKKADPVLVHQLLGPPDGLRRPKLSSRRACAEQVVLPAEVKCCGFGGDRGFVVPGAQRPRPAQAPRRRARRLPRRLLQQPDLRDRPHPRHRPALPLHRASARRMQRRGGAAGHLLRAPSRGTGCNPTTHSNTQHHAPHPPTAFIKEETPNATLMQIYVDPWQPLVVLAGRRPADHLFFRRAFAGVA